MYEARTKWYDIGIELKLSIGTLDTIREDFNRAADCLREMCIHWLKRTDPNPSWEALTKALKSPPVGEGHLAQQLRDKFCRGGEEMIPHIYSTSQSSLPGVPPNSQGSVNDGSYIICVTSQRQQAKIYPRQCIMQLDTGVVCVQWSGRDIQH